MVASQEPTEGFTMHEALTNSQVALLCDIGERHLSTLSHDDKSELENLLSQGYVEFDGSDPERRVKLTAKANEFLSSRGAGLNEA